MLSTITLIHSFIMKKDIKNDTYNMSKLQSHSNANFHKIETFLSYNTWLKHNKCLQYTINTQNIAGVLEQTF